MINKTENGDIKMKQFKVVPTTKDGQEFMGGTFTFNEFDYSNWLQNVIGNSEIKVGTKDFEVIVTENGEN